MILMDMQMGRLNGLEATVQIRQMQEHKSTPIIAMTANVFAEDKQRCSDSGMSGFLAKPFTPVELFKIIFEALSVV